jgi:glycosyltransferase involved in cell wall biosynthesis
VRVGIDVSPSTIGATGVARYTDQLCIALTAAGAELSPFAFGRGTRTPAVGARHVRVPLRVLELSWRLLAWPRAESVSGPVDVVHSIDMEAPPTGRPLVVTVHDVAAVERPELHPPRATAAQALRIRAAARADAVIAVSRSTAEALAGRGVDAEKIHVVPLGATALPAPVPPRAPIPDGFLLAVGEVNPRKDLPTLVAALARSGVDDLRLVIAGPYAEGAAAIALRRAIREHGLDERVDLVGPVDDGNLAWLYQRAVALCYPTLAEGFGLPLLEAFDAGCPVIASDLAVLRETGDGVAAFAPPGDVQAFAAQIQRIATDVTARQELAAAGRDRVRGYTWSAAAERTIDVYRRTIDP